MNKTTIIKQKTCLLMLLILLIGLDVSAQQQTLVVHGSGTVVFQRAVSKIDSVIFFKSTPTGKLTLAQQDTMLIYRSGTLIFEKAVTEIDSVYFRKITLSAPLTVIGTLTGITVQGCSSAAAPPAAISVAQLEMMDGGIIIKDTCTTKDLLTVSSTDIVSGSCPIKIDRIYTVKDACNNSITIVHVITIQDTTPPVVTGLLSGATVLGCFDASAVAAATSVAQLEAMTGGITINDACTNKTLLSVSSSDVVSGSCPITINRTYSVKDECNNKATIVHVIMIHDTTPPVVTGILTGTTVQGSAASAPLAAATVAALELLPGSIRISDACTSKSNLTINSVDVSSGSCLITITRTYTVKDECYNSVTIVHLISMKDTTLQINLDLINIPAGTFIMGSPTTEVDRDVNEIQHQVTLSAFKMSKYSITNAQYAAFLNAKKINGDGLFANGNYPTQPLIYDSSINENGYYDWGLHFTGEKWIPVQGYENLPVSHVTWYGAAEFAASVCGRLPTEAEWEYACRAGTTTPFNKGNCLSNLDANYIWEFPYSTCTNTDTKYPAIALPVGSYQPNAWGLYDMHGNGWDWCSDWFGNYSTAPQTNPTGPNNGTKRVRRGGGWHNYARYCRSAFRYSDPPYAAYSGIGFRLVFDVNQ